MTLGDIWVIMCKWFPIRGSFWVSGEDKRIISLSSLEPRLVQTQAGHAASGSCVRAWVDPVDSEGLVFTLFSTLFGFLQCFLFLFHRVSWAFKEGSGGDIPFSALCSCVTSVGFWWKVFLWAGDWHRELRRVRVRWKDSEAQLGKS